MPILKAGDLRDVWRSLVAAVTSTELDYADKVGPARIRHNLGKAADAAAATAASFGLDPVTDVDFKVTSVRFTPGAALTSDDTNYATLSLVYNNGAGGSDTVVATATTKTSGGGGTGNWTADTPVTIAITAANAVVPAGSNLQFKIAKTGTGVVVPAGGAHARGYAQ
jgi:hypothetical protein